GCGAIRLPAGAPQHAHQRRADDSAEEAGVLIMADFALPKNSKVKKGRHFAAQPGAKEVRTFHVYRWDPDTDENPRLDSFEVDVSNTPMVLDVLLKIKNEIDPTVTLRRSCRE